MKFFIWSVMAIVILAIIAGFFIVGSPQTERLRKLDDRRVADLQNIQWQAVNFWQQKGRLPDSLGELSDDISGWAAPKDPETSRDYEYIKGENLNFSLCAEFVLANNEAAAEFSDYILPEPAENWTHPAGRHCFERTIDSDRYPRFEKPKPLQ